MTWVSEYVAQLEACLLTEFGETCMWGRQPGAEASLDGCGCDGDSCGQWYITVRSIYPYTEFPDQGTTGGCGAALGALLSVGIVRCVDVPEEGEPPDQATMAAAFDRQMDDALALFQQIVCCSPGRKFMVEVGSWTPYGPEGACVGGEWTVDVTVK